MLDKRFNNWRFQLQCHLENRKYKNEREINFLLSLGYIHMK